MTVDEYLDEVDFDAFGYNKHERRPILRKNLLRLVGYFGTEHQFDDHFELADSGNAGVSEHLARERAAATMGRAKSERKAASSRENGEKGGGKK